MAWVDSIPEWTAVVGAALGLYAATVSTWQEVRYLRDEKPRIKVTLSLGRILNTGDDKDKLFINFVNVGKIPVTVSSLPAFTIVGVKGRKYTLHSTKYPLPQRLEPYADNTAWADLEKLPPEIDWDAIKNGRECRIVSLIEDASGKRHKSLPYVFFQPKQRTKVVELGVGPASTAAD